MSRFRLTASAFLFFSVIFSSFTACAGEEKLVAANYSDRYHVASCKIAQKIHPDDLVVYKNPEEAVAAGLAPCKKCNPPVPADFKTVSQNFELRKKSGVNPEEE